MGDDKLIAVGGLSDPDGGRPGGGPGRPDAAPPGDPDASAAGPDASTTEPDAGTAPPDASGQPSDAAPPSPDAAPPPPEPDAAPGPTCGSSVIDVGPPSSFAEGTATYFSSYRMYVVRDSAGLYAMSANCTHRGTAVVDEGTYFWCPSHDARFDWNGGVISGPTSTPLPHFAICVLAGGHVAVDKSQTVSPGTRLNL